MPQIVALVGLQPAVYGSEIWCHMRGIIRWNSENRSKKLRLKAVKWECEGEWECKLVWNRGCAGLGYFLGVNTFFLVKYVTMKMEKIDWERKGTCTDLSMDKRMRMALIEWERLVARRIEKWYVVKDRRRMGAFSRWIEEWYIEKDRRRIGAFSRGGRGRSRRHSLRRPEAGSG